MFPFLNYLEAENRIKDERRMIESQGGDEGAADTERIRKIIILLLLQERERVTGLPRLSVPSNHLPLDPKFLLLFSYFRSRPLISC